MPEAFPIINGMKQYLVLTMTLFSVYFTMLFNQTKDALDVDDVVYIGCRQGVNFFDIKRLRNHSYKDH